MKNNIKTVLGIGLACVLLAILVCVAIFTIKGDKACDKAIEEFTFDYNEEIIAKDIQVSNSYYIITIYGEYTMVTYIYKDGEIWNYENRSN